MKLSRQISCIITFIVSLVAIAKLGPFNTFNYFLQSLQTKVLNIENRIYRGIYWKKV